ncbi:MAG: exodeoxyribonuclease VII small subunit [Oscillospiraceae bacterium]|jgi:exodeoxyribonuclease VII small subunit|nr:exodeoxyribonuclease VII small subunit [Oscillospiraceae bacterium]
MPTNKEKKLDYEAAFARMEEIAALLEQGSLPLERALALFEEGTKLAGKLSKQLEAAEQTLQTLSLEEGQGEDGA